VTNDILQAVGDPDGAAVSSVQAARRRRPGGGLKPGQDKALLNGTLGATTVMRDGRCEYGKG
jgi:hypothetical protein